MLRSTALLLEYGLGRPEAGVALRRAIQSALHAAPTADLGGTASTSEFGAVVRAQLGVDDGAVASYREGNGSRA